jgi:hypothetical protein
MYWSLSATPQWCGGEAKRNQQQPTTMTPRKQRDKQESHSQTDNKHSHTSQPTKTSGLWDFVYIYLYLRVRVLFIRREIKKRKRRHHVLFSVVMTDNDDDAALVAQLAREVWQYFACTGCTWIKEKHYGSVMHTVRTMCRLKSWMSIALIWAITTADIHTIGIVPFGGDNNHGVGDDGTVTWLGPGRKVHVDVGVVPLIIPHVRALPPHLMPREWIFVIGHRLDMEQTIEVLQLADGIGRVVVNCELADATNLCRLVGGRMVGQNLVELPTQMRVISRRDVEESGFFYNKVDNKTSTAATE